MIGADKGTAELLDGSKLHIGIVQARFNEGVTNALLDACRSELLALGVPECHITLVANAILTVEDMPQALARQTDKGRDAARVAVEMVHLLGDTA